MVDIEASLKYIKGSCYKLNDVADLVRNLPVIEADMQLAFCERRVAVIVRKLLKSAVANAEHNFKIDKNRLYVSRVDVGRAFVLKRSMPRGRGRSSRIEKRYSNIRVVLSNIDDTKRTSKMLKKNVAKKKIVYNERVKVDKNDKEKSGVIKG